MRTSPIERIVVREILDHLDPSDPSAVHSQGDLSKLNRIMGHASALRRELGKVLPRTGPARIMELGCGDGSLLLRALRNLPHAVNGSVVFLVDARPTLHETMLGAYRSHGWEARFLTEDAFAVLQQTSPGSLDCVVANLLLHHFEEGRLRKLLAAIALSARAFVALEPRRATLGRIASRLLAVIGCNNVTRHDAAVSVRAGFLGNELSAMWPSHPGWKLHERGMGMFSHKFVAHRIGQ